MAAGWRQQADVWRAAQQLASRCALGELHGPRWLHSHVCCVPGKERLPLLRPQVSALVSYGGEGLQALVEGRTFEDALIPELQSPPRQDP
jgi:hypothetical protein